MKVVAPQAVPDRGRRLANRSIGALYLAGAAIGLMSLAVPHGRSFNIGADIAASTVAAVVGTLVWNMRPLRASGTHLLLGLAGVVVAAGVTSGHGDSVSLSAAVLFVWLALAAGLFLNPVGVGVQVTWSAILYALSLVLSGNSAAPAEWLFITGTASVAAAVTARNQAELRRLAGTDPLTGLANRNTLFSTLEREMSRAHRSGRPLTVAVADLDDFKAVNDRLGHAGGDQALIDTATRWRSGLRGADLLARVGGDEFVTVMPDTSEASAEQILERLANRFSPHPWSVGLAAWNRTETAPELIDRADRVLYLHKLQKDENFHGRQDGSVQADPTPIASAPGR